VPRLGKIPRLRALKTPAKSATEISVYFDTKNRRLRKKGLMLRVRRVGDRYSNPRDIRTCSSATNGKAKSTAQCPTCASLKARRSSRC
jgi:hypothetical protein